MFNKSSSTENKQIAIPTIELGECQIDLRGVTPLLENRFSEDAVESIEGPQQKKAKVAKAARDPQREYENAIHPYPNAPKDVHGGFPAIAIKKALVAAGGRFADEKMTTLRGAIQVKGDLLPIYGPKPVMRRDRVVIGMGKTSIAYRPMWTSWRIPVQVSFNKSKLQIEQVVNLFKIAGFAIGIGPWRPENDGIFGQFEVENTVERLSRKL